jgi:hypothetical protein
MTHETGHARIEKLNLGPFDNCVYVVECLITGRGVIIDAAAEADVILEAAAGVAVERILKTHGHADHLGALDPVIAALGVPWAMHPADIEIAGRQPDELLTDGPGTHARLDHIRAGAGGVHRRHALPRWTRRHTMGLLELRSDHGLHRTEDHAAARHHPRLSRPRLGYDGRRRAARPGEVAGPRMVKLDIALQARGDYPTLLDTAHYCEANGIVALALPDHYLASRTSVTRPSLSRRPRPSTR